MSVTLMLGDCLERLRELPDASVDACVTDPPYGLSFMGKGWDHAVPSVEVWREVLRVLKPGAHLLAFFGTRTYHRGVVAIEDAGFEIRDQIGWAFGSGFPKSHDVSKAIDKVNAEGDRLLRFTAWMRSTGLSARAINEATGTNMASHYLTDKTQPAIPTAALWAKLRPLCGDVPEWVDQLVARVEAEREVLGHAEMPDTTKVRPGFLGEAHAPNYDGSKRLVPITAPATPEAQRWAGWGTALKPAWEPIVVARKPLDGTVAANVLAWGTGAINVDGCRVGTGDSLNGGGYSGGSSKTMFSGLGRLQPQDFIQPSGRWPANLIHDGSPEVVGLFPWQRSPAPYVQQSASVGLYGPEAHHDRPSTHHGDSGSAARFFYCAKASRADREDGLDGFEARRVFGDGGASLDGISNTSGPRRNHHPTVKPTDLMRYLCRLVTPPGGTVLDPFMGSGSTGRGAVIEGFGFIGCELDPEYLEIARARIAAVTPEPPAPPLASSPALQGQLRLF